MKHCRTRQAMGHVRCQGQVWQHSRVMGGACMSADSECTRMFEEHRRSASCMLLGVGHQGLQDKARDGARVVARVTTHWVWWHGRMMRWLGEGRCSDTTKRVRSYIGRRQA